MWDRVARWVLLLHLALAAIACGSTPTTDAGLDAAGLDTGSPCGVVPSTDWPVCRGNCVTSPCGVPRCTDAPECYQCEGSAWSLIVVDCMRPSDAGATLDARD